MIRPVLAFIIAAVIILFVWQYTQFVDRIRPEPIQITRQQSSGKFDLRVITTFAAVGNDFGSPALSVKFRGRMLIERFESIVAGHVVEVRDVEGIVVGPNEFLVQVTPVEELTDTNSGAFSLDSPTSDAQENESIARAVRVEILRDGAIVESQLIWSSSQGPFGELVRIDVREGGDH